MKLFTGLCIGLLILLLIVTVNAGDAYAPSASFTFIPASGTIPLTVTFTDTSLNGPTSWNWSFGDGTYSIIQNPSHVYSIAGSYTVILNATNILGSSNFSQVITALPSVPVVSFTANPTIGSSPLLVTFTDTSSGTITSWYWTFGDGNTSVLQNPTHTYSALGTYYASLFVTSPVGDNTSSPVAIYVVASPVPFIDFVGVPVSSGSAPLTVQYTDLSSALGGITAWNWSFGDGTYSNSQNPLHTYITNGQYSVTLVALSGVYQNYTSKVGYINIGVALSTISANFVANPTYSATSPVSVQFTDTSVCNPVCTDWAWDFDGDGLTDSLVQNPLYTYTNPGTYSPKLIVSNGPASGTRVRNLYITVGPIYVPTTIPQPSTTWNPGYNGTSSTYTSSTNVDLANSTYLKYWLQNFSSTGNFSVYGFAFGMMAPIMHVFGFWIYLIIWGLYLFAVWVRSQDVTLPLIIGILTIGVFGLLFPKESLPVILIMFAICGAIIIAKLMKDSI